MRVVLHYFLFLPPALIAELVATKKLSLIHHSAVFLSSLVVEKRPGHRQCTWTLFTEQHKQKSLLYINPTNLLPPHSTTFPVPVLFLLCFTACHPGHLHKDTGWNQDKWPDSRTVLARLGIKWDHKFMVAQRFWEDLFQDIDGRQATVTLKWLRGINGTLER